MKGIIVEINNKKGFIAVNTENGISVIELLGDYELEIEDEISGNLESLGSEVLFNVTKKEQMDVYIQEIHCSPENAKLLMS